MHQSGAQPIGIDYMLEQSEAGWKVFGDVSVVKAVRWPPLIAAASQMRFAAVAWWACSSRSRRSESFVEAEQQYS